MFGPPAKPPRAPFHDSKASFLNETVNMRPGGLISYIIIAILAILAIIGLLIAWL